MITLIDYFLCTKIQEKINIILGNFIAFLPPLPKILHGNSLRLPTGSGNIHTAGKGAVQIGGKKMKANKSRGSGNIVSAQTFEGSTEAPSAWKIHP